MADDLLTRQGLDLVYAESTYGTDAVETEIQGVGALAYQQFESVSVAPQAVLVEPVRRRNHFSGVPHKFIKDHLAWTINGALLGATNPGVSLGQSPAYADVLLGCGLSSTSVDGVSDTFKPTTAMNEASWSQYSYQRMSDNALHRMTYGLGMRGDLVLNLDSLTDEAKYTINALSANFPDSTDTANFNVWSDDLAFFDADGDVILEKDGATDPTHTGGKAMAAGACMMNHTAVLTIDSVQCEVTGLSVGLNNTVSAKQITGNSTGELTTAIKLTRQGRIGGSFTLAETGAGFEKIIDLMLAATQVSLTYVLSNGTGNDRLTLTVPTLQVGIISQSDANGLANWSVPFFCNENDSLVGDDDFTLVYDVAP